MLRNVCKLTKDPRERQQFYKRNETKVSSLSFPTPSLILLCFVRTHPSVGLGRGTEGATAFDGMVERVVAMLFEKEEGRWVLERDGEGERRFRKGGVQGMTGAQPVWDVGEGEEKKSQFDRVN